jgi:hypothetical protein
MAVVGLASPAGATQGDVYTCDFEGLSGQMVGDENGYGGVDAINDDRSIDQERGTYNLAAGAWCTFYDASTGELWGAQRYSTAGKPSPPNARFESLNADYYDHLCGTAIWEDANGDSTWVLPEIGRGIPVPTFAYRIDFAGGVGTMQIKPGQYGDFRGQGEVRITPVWPGNCVTTDVAEFEVSGHFSFVGP